MSWITKSYVIKLKREKEMPYNKSLRLNEIETLLTIKLYDECYDDYVRRSLLYFNEDFSKLAEELSVDKICPKGLYIMGIYGGEEKEGEEKYAGLVLDEYREEGAKFRFRLSNIKNVLVVPIDLLRRFDVKVHKMIYRSEVNPFKLKKYINVMLSCRGGESLKSFLKEALDLNYREISSNTVKMIEKLVKELRQPSEIIPLNLNKYYVVYRRTRAFTAFAFKPTSPDVVAEETVAYAECKNEETAYYYAAVLNYLAFKVVMLKRPFLRDQYARPLLAIHMAGLSWTKVDVNVRSKVVELSKKLHQKAPDKEYGNQKVALKEIALHPEFKELLQLLDSQVEDEKLEEALKMVSGEASKE